MKDKDLDAISGPVHRPGHHGYERARVGFNLVLDHRPALIVEATRASDVVAAVRLATREGRAVAVMSTGHGPTVPADGTVMVHTGRMSQVHVDPQRQTAQVGAGARWQNVIQATARHGLAPLNGSSPHVGAIGYTLGGGVGLLGRRYGYAADHVRWIEVVTADGELRCVTPDSEPDLFWAMRGAGSNFGVVTAMEIDLFPVQRLLGGGLYFGAEASGDVLQAYARWAKDAPDDMASSVLLLDYPDDAMFPESLRGRHLTEVRFAYCGQDLTQGWQLIEPFRGMGNPVRDTVRAMSYAEVGTIHHEPTDIPVAALDKNALLGDLDAAAMTTLSRHAGPQARAPFAVELRAFGGALSRPPIAPNAVGGRDASFVLFAAAGSMADTPRRDALFTAMRPWATGMGYLNFMGVEDARTGVVRAAYRSEDFARLVRLKAKYDPANTFRINHNIPPVSHQNTGPRRGGRGVPDTDLAGAHGRAGALGRALGPALRRGQGS
jgi:FAD/FMN-containing dehydrogenase